MIIAVASGKGGTGKTTVALNLSLALSSGERVALLDCDVEEPNCHLFLKPEIRERRTVGIPVPEVDRSRCTVCGACSRMCRYRAIVCVRTGPIVFPELCHGCGGCAAACPAGAISEVDRPVGVVEAGSGGSIEFVQGRLNVGEPMSPPVIREVKRHAPIDGTTVIDCPPGTSCPVVAAVLGSDLVLLVTEPTPFGLNDLGLAVEMVRDLGLAFGVVVNRADAGDDGVETYCRREDIPTLLRIPEDRRVAEAYSRGEIALRVVPGFQERFDALVVAIRSGFGSGPRDRSAVAGREPNRWAEAP